MPKKKPIPYIAFGVGELEKNPPVPATIKCKCGKTHKVKQSVDSDGTPGLLHYYTCTSVKPKATYLCGVGGKLVTFKGAK